MTPETLLHHIDHGTLWPVAEVASIPDDVPLMGLSLHIK